MSKYEVKEAGGVTRIIDVGDKPHRFLRDSGGWAYIQWPNGNLLFVEVPAGFQAGGTLENPYLFPYDWGNEEEERKARKAWEAITAKFGEYREGSYIGKGLVLVSLLALLYEIRRRRK